MRTIQVVTSIIVVSLLLGSCETDFDTNAAWEDITVVYGLMDQNDSVYYLKINKAFLGEGNALVYAEEEDSSNYQFPIQVSVEEWSDEGQLIQTLIFDTTTVYNKEPGLFYYPEQVLYKSSISEPYDWDYEVIPPNDTIGRRAIWLNETSTYRLNIVFPDSSKLVSSSTVLVQDFSITKPPSHTIFVKFSTEPANPTKYEWDKAENGGKNEFKLVFNYRELEDDTKDTVDRHIVLTEGEASSSQFNSSISYFYWDSDFYASCINYIPYDDAQEEDNVLARFSGPIDIIVSVAESEYTLYMEVYEPSTSIVQERPPYTNVDNGIGIFSARYSKLSSKKLHPESAANLTNIEDPDLKFVY